MTEPVLLRSANRTFSVYDSGGGKRLRIFAAQPEDLVDFDGEVTVANGGRILEGPLSAKNATALRTSIPWLTPRPIGAVTSAGLGDRLGMATPGHVGAFRRYGAGVVPFFAQQSIREMNRLGRTPQQVLDEATYGCVEAGWEGTVGADADHLKTTDDIDRCLQAGFTSFTIDPGDHVRDVPQVPSGEDLAHVPWADLEDSYRAMVARYSGLSVDLDSSTLEVGELELNRAAAKYGSAVAHAVRMYRHLQEHARHPVEVEVSVDETEEPTTLVEHVYLATEMQRLGMKWVSFAPRYIGRFEKAVEYIGDLDAFSQSLVDHAGIAQVYGPYKLSLHSGSDKFSIYEPAVAATNGMVHLKTSGTSYLVALEVAAMTEPALLRKIYDASREAYRGARASYTVSAQLDRTPASDKVSDQDLIGLLMNSDSRQILHVGFGVILGPTVRGGEHGLSLLEWLRSVLGREAARYAARLEEYLGRHVQPFSSNA